ncbi:hypothetical protein [Komagataeibacter diospyri]|uniref:Uncharacterized protein n=1 Tax=Komagataeibacter diospyri TaxID=1932662 RepID=A0A4P5P2J2_9PROT|nr:hypothetical protein [Komagataeibacter diospyri]GCE83047.1 hypothetical protein MSKU9_1188 [Komagataeibacter diospyri]GCE89665.1 hypothetical protein MSKU15_1266 [Komagataeibacter diospyri]
MSDADAKQIEEFLIASREAPIVFTDHIPYFGHAGSVIAVTLAAGKPSQEGLRPFPVAHLRMPAPTAKILIESLQKALAMMEKSGQPIN